MQRILRLCWLSLLLIVVSTGLLLAQTETGQITGTVSDPTGAVVPNAKVTITAVGKETTRTATTNSSGIFTFTNLLSGEYVVKVEAAGFSTSTQRAAVSVGSRADLTVKLEVGRTDTVVQVTETATQVNLETQTLSTTVSNKQIVDLPTLTRDPYALVAVSGNVAGTTPDGRGVGYAINGQRAASTNILLDGAANNDEFTATVGQAIPLDSVQEFSLLTNNFGPEYGRATGGVVNLATKSGSNDFHGTVYWFNRVSALGSNDFNNNANEIAKSVYTRNQPGYSIGGPVVKNKLFFFQSTEWIYIRSQGAQVTMVPTPELIAASPANVRDYFSQLGTLRSGLQPLQTYTKAQLLASNVALCGRVGGPCDALPLTMPLFTKYSYNVPSDAGGGTPVSQNFGVARVDYNLSEKTTMYGRYAWVWAENPVGTNSTSPWAGYDSGTTNVDNNIMWSAVHTFSPTVVNQSKVVFNRLNNQQPLGERGPTSTLYLGSTSGATRILGTSVAMPGYLPYSPGNGIPFGGPQNFIQLFDDMSVSKGKHQFRFGGQYTYIRDNRTFGAYMNSVQAAGTNLGRGMDNMLDGVNYSYQTAVNPQGKYPCNGVQTPGCTVTLPVGQPNFSRSNRYNEWAGYINDTWRVTRKFTLNLGVRYEYFGTQHNKNPYLDSNFYPAGNGSWLQSVQYGEVALAPDSSIGRLWKPDYNNFGPRLGFAYDLTGDGKTSLRGGWGIGYERNFGNVTFNVIQNPPNYAVISLIAGTDIPVIPISTSLTGPLSGNTGSKALPPVSLRAVNPDIGTAWAQMWNLSVERQVTSNLMVALEYSGSKGSGLYTIENPNRAGGGNVYLGTPCTKGSSPGNPGNCTARILNNKGYTNINMRGASGFSNYNALNLRINYTEMARKTGLNLVSNLTWGHTIDNLSDTFSSSGNQYNLGLTDPFNPKLDKGDSQFDLRWRFSVGAVWEIPFARNSHGVTKMLADGWVIAPIYTARTGSPYTIYDTTYSYAVYPRLMVLDAAPKTANMTQRPTSTPNLNDYYDMTKLNVYGDYVNPVTNTSDFGPYPAMMTGRDLFRGPGWFNLDLGIYKNTRINERLNTQLRFEMYNALNHANLFLDTGNADWAAANYINSYNSGNRNVQLAIKFLF